jgi:hypothetical protein
MTRLVCSLAFALLFSVSHFAAEAIEVAVRAGCSLACENYSWSLKILDAKTKSREWKRGTKALGLGFTEAAKALLDLETAGVKYSNGPVMEPTGWDHGDAPRAPSTPPDMRFSASGG